MFSIDFFFDFFFNQFNPRWLEPKDRGPADPAVDSCGAFTRELITFLLLERKYGLCF